MISLHPTLPLIESSSYIVIFIIMVLEGGIVTYLAAFASSLGFLNLYAIIFLATLGNTIGDLIYYVVGRYGKRAVSEKYLKNKVLQKNFISKIEYGVKNHPVKTMALVKFITPLPAPGLTAIGMIEMPFKKFLSLSVILSLIYSLVFSLLGFYTGEAYQNFLKYFKRLEIATVITVLLAILVFFIYKRLVKDVEKKEHIEVKKGKLKSWE